MKYVFISILVFFTLSAFAQKEDSLILNKNVFIQKSDIVPILDNNQEKVGEVIYGKSDGGIPIIQAICTFTNGKKVVIDNPYEGGFVYSDGILFNYGSPFLACFSSGGNIRSININNGEVFNYKDIHMLPKITIDNLGNLYIVTMHSNGKGYYVIKYDGKNKKIAFEKPLFKTEDEFDIDNIRMTGIEFFNDGLYISYRTQTPETYIEKWSVNGEFIYNKKIDAYFTSFKILDNNILIGTFSGHSTIIYNINNNISLGYKEHLNSYLKQILVTNKVSYVITQNELCDCYEIYSTFDTGIIKMNQLPFNETNDQTNKYHFSYISEDKKGNKNINIIKN